MSEDDDFLDYVPPQAVASPCVNICRIEPRTRLCLGCRRTIDEIARWSRIDDGERQAILDALKTRPEPKPR